MAENTDIIDGEEWRDVPGWPGYRASSLGRVSGPRRLLSCKVGPLGYAYTNLSDHRNGRRQKILVHKIICEAFLGPRPEGMQVNHINNKRADNRLSNLEYLTAKQNCQHRRVHGTYPTGENNNRAKLTANQVSDIRRRYSRGESVKSMALEYAVHKNTVRLIVNGQTWTE